MTSPILVGQRIHAIMEPRRIAVDWRIAPSIPYGKPQPRKAAYKPAAHVFFNSNHRGRRVHHARHIDMNQTLNGAQNVDERVTFLRAREQRFDVVVKIYKIVVRLVEET